MEFNGKNITGTENSPGVLVTEAMIRDLWRPESSDIYELSDQALEGIKEFLRTRDYSEDIERAVDQLFLEPSIYSLTDFRIHLSELTGDSYIRCGDQDKARFPEESGIVVIEDDFELAEELEVMMQSAAEELVLDITTDPDFLRVLDPSQLSDADREVLNSDNFSDILISRVEDMLMAKIASIYMQRLDESRTDVVSYGLETALAMNKDNESKFAGELSMAKILVNYGFMSEADLKDMERFGLIDDQIASVEVEVCRYCEGSYVCPIHSGTEGVPAYEVDIIA